MNRFWLLIFGLPFVAAATIDLKDEPLDWPETYHFEAVRMSISAGNVQDYSVWKTNHSSRVDYNKGAVKSIIVDENAKYRYGVSYEIHPETDDGEDAIFKCNVMLGSEDNIFDLKIILPETDNFEYVGPDSQTVENTIKFVAEDSDLETKTIKTIWATYDEKNNNWHPVSTTKRLNHEMALVGYGERDGDTYWIIKNSWGPDWGVEGYLLISSRNNNCGIATEPTYVVY